MIYLASPYSGDADYMAQNYRLVSAETVDLLRRGFTIYSPIVHCHHLAKQHDLPRDFAFWQHYNHGMIVAARELWVFQSPGWQESVGVAGEIAFARSMGKIVKFGGLGEDYQHG
jgi:hypothetical protein